MKVHLGPYIDPWRCRIHSRYMDKKYDYIWPDDAQQWTAFERALEKIEDGIQIIYKYTINQYLNRKKRKEKVHIDRYDMWSMDHTLALIILPMLKLLKEQMHGSHEVDDEDVPEHLRSTAAPLKENEWDTDENHTKRWDWVLDEMIYTFECSVNEDWDDQFYSGKHDIRFVPTEVDGKKFFEYETGPNNTFKVDREGLNKAWERRKNGMMLFAKYYHALWD